MGNPPGCQFSNLLAKQDSPSTYSFFCLENRVRTYDLPRPRRVNNHRYLSSFTDSHYYSFPGDSRNLIHQWIFAVYARIELAVPKRQSGRLAITSIDLFVIPRGIEPLTLGLENPYSIPLSYGTVGNPRKIWTFNPRFKRPVL